MLRHQPGKPRDLRGGIVRCEINPLGLKNKKIQVNSAISGTAKTSSRLSCEEKRAELGKVEGGVRIQLRSRHGTERGGRKKEGLKKAKHAL